MKKWIKQFYSDVQPIVTGIKEYRNLLNDENASNKIKFIRKRISTSFWGASASKNNLMTNRIDSVRQPQELKKKELKDLSINLWSVILNNLDRWIYGSWGDLWEIEEIIRNRIAKNLKNWDFTAIDFVVDSIKDPYQYVIPENSPSDMYWNN